MPRLRQLKYRKKTEYQVKEQWVVEMSVFADYISDTQLLIDQLFESDWNMIQKPNFNSDDELNRVKAEFK